MKKVSRDEVLDYVTYAEQRDAIADRSREDGKSLYDSAERRSSTAEELEVKKTFLEHNAQHPRTLII